MTTIQHKRGTAARWLEVNPVLADGEIGLETDTLKVKFGDGISQWASLAYFSGSAGATGTVTSVGLTVPTGLTVSGSPVTTAGTLAVSFDTGYSIPTTASQTNWDTAYGWGNHSSAGYALLTATQTFTGLQTFVPSGTGSGAVLIQGLSGQTVDFFNVQSSTGTNRLRVDSAGVGYMNGITAYTNNNILVSGFAQVNQLGVGSNLSTARANITTQNTTEIALLVRGMASQTANLQEWQNSSGTVLGSISASGAALFRPVNFAGNVSGGITLQDNGGNWAAGGMYIKSDSGGNPRLGFQAINAASEILSLVGGQVGINTTTPGTLGSSSVQAQLGIVNALAAGVGLVVRAAASQTANIFEVQNSSGTVLVRSSASGQLTASGFHNGTIPASTSNTFYATAAGNKAVVVQGAASQTANLTEWQDSSAGLLALVASTGSFRTTGHIHAGSNTFIDGQIYSGATNATTKGLVVRGAASQTADLTQWQNSAASVLAKVDASGNITGASFVRTGGTSSQFLKADGTVDSSSYIATTSSYFAGHHPEGRIMYNAYLTNDFANARLRGSTITITQNGSPYSVSNANIDAMFDGTASFWNISPTSGFTFPLVIEFTLPRTLTYGTWVGIGFGNSGWRANSVQIEVYSNDSASWVTVVNTTTNTSEDVFAAVSGLTNGNAAGISSIRYTLSNPNSTQLRIAHIWGYNFASDMWSTTMMPRAGGAFYGQVTNTTNSASTVPLIAKGATSQTANLQEWQSSAGTVLTSILSTGLISTTTGITATGNYANSFGGASISNVIVAVRPNATNIGLVIRGAASQSGNLQEWQNSSGTILGGVSAFGGLGLNASPSLNSFLYINAGTAAVGQQITRTSSNPSDFIQYLTSTTVNGGRNANAQIYTGSTTPQTFFVGGATTAATGDGTTATITTTSTHNLAVGDRITVAGITPTGYNGTYLVTAVTTNTVSYANATTGSQTVAGTISVDAQMSIVARSNATPALVVKSAGFATDVTRWINSSGSTVASINPYGTITSNASANSFNSDNPTNWILRLRGSGSQLLDSLAITNSSATNIAGFSGPGQLYTGSTGPIATQVGGATTATSGTGATATITLTSNHNLAVGDRITVAGITPSGYNGTFIVNGVPASNQVSYGSTATGAQTVAGTVSVDSQASIVARSAGTAGLVVRGATSQASALQRWENSSGTALTYVNSSGSIQSSAYSHGFGSTSVSAWGSYIPVVEVRTTSTSYSGLNIFTNGGPFIRPYDSSGNARGSWNYDGSVIVGQSITKLGTLSVYTDAAATIGAVIRGAASQSANLQEWQDSTGTVQSSIGSNGFFISKNGAALGGLGAGFAATAVSIGTGTTTNRGLVVQGVASQTADLQQWQDSSGTVLSKINSSGWATFARLENQGLTSIGTSVTGTSSLLIDTNLTTRIGAIIKGVASQTADLQQWQNNSGTVLAEVDASGNMLAASFIKTGGTSSQFLKADGSVDSSTYLTTSSTSSALTSFGANPNLNNPLLTSISTIGGGGNEGGQINFARVTDGAAYWYIDSYGSTSTPDLRFIENATERFKIGAGGALYVGGSAGTSGQVLTSAGTGSSPTWTTVSGTSSNSFTTIAVPSGTNPAASSSTDTLTFAAGTGITITGNSSTDTITIASTITDTNTTYDLTSTGTTTASINLVPSSGATDSVTITGSGATSVSHSAGAITVSSTDTNTFPTTWTWTGGTTSGPTASITGTSSTISVAAVPAASSTASGIVTTAAQTLAGDKTLTGSLYVRKGGTTTGAAPIYFDPTSAAVLTGATAGAVEYDGNAFYGTSNASARGVIPTSFYYTANATTTLVNNTTAQSIFGLTNGISLAAGYVYEVELYVSGTCGSTAGTLQLLCELGAGSQTIFTNAFRGSAPAAMEGRAVTSISAVSNVTSSSTGTAFMIFATGKVYNSSGVSQNWNPKIAFSVATGTAPTTSSGSYVKVTPIGTTAAFNVGGWS